MRKLLALTTVILLSQTTFAQKIKVQKVKGNQAVVEFSGGSLKPDQVYELTSREFTDAAQEIVARNYLVALSFSLLNTKSDAPTSVSETDFSLTAKFGWNLGHFEIGPLASYSSDATGSITNSLFKIGAFADFNAISNIPGEVFLYGLGGTGSLGQYEGNGVKRDVMDLFIGPFVKWFPTGSSVAFRIDAGYIYQKQSGGIGSDNTITGLSTNVDILAYF